MDEYIPYNLKYNNDSTDILIQNTEQNLNIITETIIYTYPFQHNYNDNDIELNTNFFNYYYNYLTYPRKIKVNDDISEYDGFQYMYILKDTLLDISDIRIQYRLEDILPTNQWKYPFKDYEDWTENDAIDEKKDRFNRLGVCTYLNDIILSYKDGTGHDISNIEGLGIDTNEEKQFI